MAARGSKTTDVIGVTFSKITLGRIDSLVSKGTHGNTRQEVVRYFVEDGIREVMKEGFLPMPD
jgi:hypothetical protein